MTPFGGAEGYKAAVPSAEDPTKTDNVAAEVALKYFMGRTGNLLPYDEFKKVRPDVSPSEFGRYKAFKYDKKGDYNIMDGDFTLPTGVLKGTTDGIHGPEIQFLGRSLPLTTTIVPTAGTIIGGALGVRGRRPIKGGLIGGTAGLAAGAAAGVTAEIARRRLVSNENQMEGGNAESYL